MENSGTPLAQPLDFSTHCLPHQQYLLCFASKLSFSHEVARDVVQDTMLSALKNWATFNPNGHTDTELLVRAWLSRICINVYISQYRKSARWNTRLRQSHGDIVRGTYGVDTDGRDPRDQDAGIGDEVVEALLCLGSDEMGHKLRDIVIRADFRGESYIKIAATLNLPIGTVMSRLHRARKALADSLADYAEREYGIKQPTVVVQEPPRSVSGRARKNANATKAPATKQPKPRRVKRVVTQDDTSDLVGGEVTTDALAAG